MSDDKISDQVRAIANEWDALINRLVPLSDRASQACTEAEQILLELRILPLPPQCLLDQ
jgi:hypothetical protein